MKLSLDINGQQHEVEVDPNTPLLWVIRDHLQMTGTKFGCGMAQCGACTVHLNGTPIRSCVTPVSSVQNQRVTTIEGVMSSSLSKEAKAIADAWEEIAVVQCGYCQSGQIMSATALLKQTPNPTDNDIDNFMSGNICRCATYARIRQGIKHAAQSLSQRDQASTDTPLYYDATTESSAPQGGESHVA